MRAVDIIIGTSPGGPQDRTGRMLQKIADALEARVEEMARILAEETGTLDAQMDASADFFAKELDYKLARLTALAEPVVIVVMGVIVGFVAVALISAMYGVFQNSKTLK